MNRDVVAKTYKINKNKKSLTVIFFSLNDLKTFFINSTRSIQKILCPNLLLNSRIGFHAKMRKTAQSNQKNASIFPETLLLFITSLVRRR